MKEVVINITFLQEYYEKDYTGQIIDNPELFHGLYSCQLSIPQSSSVKFACQATINSTGNDENDKLNLMKSISKILIEKIKNLNYLDIFRIFDLYKIDLIDSEITENHYYSEKILLGDLLIESLIPQIEYVSKVEKSFKLAVEQLKDYAGYYPTELKNNYFKITSLIRYIQDIVNSSYTYLYNWYNEKQASIEYMYSDLMRRKNMNHENYIRQQDSIKRILYGYHCPDLWIKKPSLNDDLLKSEKRR